MDRQTDRQTHRSSALQFTRKIISRPSCLQSAGKAGSAQQLQSAQHIPWCPCWLFPCSSSAQHCHIPGICRQPPVPGRGAGREFCQAWPWRIYGIPALGTPLAAQNPQGHSSAPQPLLGQPPKFQLHFLQKDSTAAGFR